MPRRYIPNLQETIIEETIKMGAKVGANKISTIKLAKECGITEPAIYGRFKTKFDLLFSAYLHINKEIEELLEFIDWDKIKTLKDVKNMWIIVFGFAINKPEYISYFDSFRRTTNHDPSIPTEYRNLYINYAKKVLSVNKNKKDYTDAEYLQFWVQWVNLSLKLALLVIDDVLTLDERTKDLLFKLTFGEQLEI